MVLQEETSELLLISNLFHSNPVARTGDVRLLEGARQMDKDALTHIFDLYSQPIYNYAMRLCHDARMADEIVGDVFARFLDQLAAGFGPRTNIRSYLYEIAYHRVIDETRYSNRRTSLDSLEIQTYGPPASRNLGNRLLLEKVMNAISTRLTRDQRHVIILRFFEGMSLKETAKILGKEVNHIKVLQNRAIQSLRKILYSEEQPQGTDLPLSRNDRRKQ